MREMVGKQVCLYGSVHCAALQTSVLDDIRRSAEYCLTWGKANSGYIFCASSIPFNGIRPERYSFILDIWKQMRDCLKNTVDRVAERAIDNKCKKTSCSIFEDGL